MGRDAPAHRLAADEQFRCAHVALLDGADHRAAERVLEHRRAIRRLAPLFQVRKVEGHHRDAALRQPFGIAGHERVKMAGAGTMRQHQQGVQVAVFRGGVEGGGNGGFGISGELERNGTHNRLLYPPSRSRATARTARAGGFGRPEGSSCIREQFPRTHGRYLVDIPEHSRATLVGFHGYKENARSRWMCFAASPAIGRWG